MVEFNAFLQRFFFRSRWKQARPGYRHPECLKPHLTEQTDIFLEMMIKIVAAAEGQIPLASLRFIFQIFFFRDLHQTASVSFR